MTYSQDQQKATDFLLQLPKKIGVDKVRVLRKEAGVKRGALKRAKESLGFKTIKVDGDYYWTRV